MGRRRFLGQSAAGLLILPSGTLFGGGSSARRLNLALIGVGGRGTEHFDAFAGENIAALCDIDENHLAAAGERFPGAKHYTDWRHCLDHPGVEAVVCSTTDHTHAPIAIQAMQRGLHVFCEKPLAITVEEARETRRVYLENRHKIATQVCTQLHANHNFRRVAELVREGAIGELHSADAWGTRQIPSDGLLPPKGDPPPHLHFDLWLASAPPHPYNPGYFDAPVPGTNCLNWNMFWDFGAGQVGDMGSHTMDLAWNALDAEPPVEATAKGDPFHPEVTPVKLATSFAIPANDWRPAIDLRWHQGGAMPEPPVETAFYGIGHGVMFSGSDGWLVANFGAHAIIPKGTPFGNRVPRTGVRGGFNFYQEWLNACKGDLQTSCNFDYGSKMIETMLLGLVAFRAGGKVSYDAASGTTGDADTDALLTKTYREGWSLHG